MVFDAESEPEIAAKREDEDDVISISISRRRKKERLRMDRVRCLDCFKATKPMIREQALSSVVGVGSMRSDGHLALKRRRGGAEFTEPRFGAMSRVLVKEYGDGDR